MKKSGASVRCRRVFTELHEWEYANTETLTVMFVRGRLPTWITHWLEQRATSGLRRFRRRLEDNIATEREGT